MVKYTQILATTDFATGQKVCRGDLKRIVL